MRLFSFGGKKRVRHTRIVQNKTPGVRDAFTGHERRISTNTKETLFNPVAPSVQRARWRFVGALILVIATAVGWTMMLSWYAKRPQRATGNIIVHIATK